MDRESLRYYMPGIALITLALLIIVFPKIIVVLISGLIFVAGIIALWIGQKLNALRLGWADLKRRFREFFSIFYSDSDSEIE